MITQDVLALLTRGNTHVTANLEQAANFAIARQHYEVTIEHLLLKFLEQGDGDLPLILRHFRIDVGRLESRLLAAVDTFPIGNGGRPAFSQALLDTLEQAFLIGSLEYGQDSIRSGTILATGISSHSGSPALYSYLDLLKPIQPEELRAAFPAIVAVSGEDLPATGRYGKPQPAVDGTPAPDGALAQFTIDFTAAAAAGEIDPIYGRDVEIRQMIDILTRRRKNNPILVGEAGVGKTALVEGLALRVVSGDVPRVMRNVRIHSLDLGLLQAGAGVKGEFENRLKSVIAEIKESPTPIVTFIDEAHTLIGAGASAGQGDAANLLKPALARGELRSVAATTWSEYKKYFEKDPALARRFQLIKVDEPDEARAVIMLRGIKSKFEEAHGVRILDSAVGTCVELAERFISGRQLPDKGVDLLDTAAARVKIGRSSKPAVVEDLERRIEHAEIARAALERDAAGGSSIDSEEIARLEAEVSSVRAELAEVEARWAREKEAVARVQAARGEAEEPESEEETAGEDSGHQEAEPDREEDLHDEDPPNEDQSDEDQSEDLQDALAALAEIQGKDPLVPLEVTPDVVAAIVADWTGIPAGRMVRDQARSVLELEQTLGAKILGQDAAMNSLARHIRSAHAGLGNPAAPQGVFLLVGPSGIGKTETGLALADLLYGGERFMTTINMSEYMEAHTVSRLIGSPPGYVGYGEGGILTEAVRQRPYSVVLFDEVEKSHPDVMNLFYQVFDKGMLADGEGREIDFKNTVLVMTSNLATETIVAMCADEVVPDPDELVEAIRPELRDRFKPALLARMQIVPYYPLSPDVIRRIVDLKLNKIVRRLAENARIELLYSESVAEWIAERCTVEETGARNIDAVIQGQMLPGISTEILHRMAREEPISKISIDLGADETMKHTFE